MSRCTHCDNIVDNEVPGTNKDLVKNMPCGCVFDLVKKVFIDPVNHPAHYNNSLAKCECGRKIECIDVTRHLDFLTGNIIKYLWRYKDKDGVEGLKKAQWYLNDLIKQESKSE